MIIRLVGGAAKKQARFSQSGSFPKQLKFVNGSRWTKVRRSASCHFIRLEPSGKISCLQNEPLNRDVTKILDAADLTNWYAL